MNIYNLIFVTIIYYISGLNVTLILCSKSAVCWCVCLQVCSLTILASVHLAKVKAGIQILHENMTRWNSHFIPNEKVTLKIMQANTRKQYIMWSLNRNGQTHTNPPAYLEETVKHSCDLVVSVLSIISFINGYER